MLITNRSLESRSMAKLLDDALNRRSLLDTRDTLQVITRIMLIIASATSDVSEAP